MAVSLGTSPKNRLRRGLRSSIILESLAEGLQTAQEGPRRPPRRPPRGPRTAPKTARGAAKTAQEVLRTASGRTPDELEDDGKRLRRAPLVQGLNFL